MKKWKRNSIIVVILLFVCVAVYLNLAPGANKTDTAGEPSNADEAMDAQQAQQADAIPDEPAAEPESAAETYFKEARLDRLESRDTALTLLEEAAVFEGAEDGEVAARIKTIADRALTETQIETMIQAKGFEDCVAVISDAGVSVMVPASGLTGEQVAQITEIVITEAQVTAAQLEIVEVS